VDGLTGLTVWATDEPCPVCAAGLLIVGYGEPVQTVECRACGWSEQWDLSDDNGKDGGAR
jgi:tRNA(Arg) A34 adenosine deaminase TadA